MSTVAVDIAEKHFAIGDPLLRLSAANGQPTSIPLQQTPESRKKAAVLRVVIAAGATGGHLFPAIAIAEEIVSRNARNEVLFIGAGKPFEIRILSAKGFAYQSIAIEGIKGRGLKEQLKAVLNIPAGTAAAYRILKRFRPCVVLGMGAYTAGPVCMAARLQGIRVAVHEQNMIPGLTNRILALFANRIYVSFAQTRFRRRTYTLRLVGNPIRRDFFRNTQIAADAHARQKKETDPSLKVLILGGSQGAHAINLAMVDALRRLKDKDRFGFTHQTGQKDASIVEAAYRRHGVNAVVAPFFNDMPARYREADLVICRAGASTLAEITVMQKAAILVPYPYAADNHQVYNARTLASVNAAELVLQTDLNGDLLAKRLSHYAGHRHELRQMAAGAGRIGQPYAARMLVNDLYHLVFQANG